MMIMICSAAFTYATHKNFGVDEMYIIVDI